MRKNVTYIVKCVTNESKCFSAIAVSGRQNMSDAESSKAMQRIGYYVYSLFDLNFTTAVRLGSFLVIVAKVAHHSLEGRSEAHPVVLNSLNSDEDIRVSDVLIVLQVSGENLKQSLD